MRVLLDPNWRRMDELFRSDDLATLSAEHDLVWAKDEKMPEAALQAELAGIDVLIGAKPEISSATLDAAPNLKAIIEVSGAFPETIDYGACRDRGIEILSCAPGFRESVAEMAVAMALSGARGLIQEHELMRRGGEHWLADNDGTDFTLYRSRIGFIGYGQIAREIRRLLAPFRVDVAAYDPWLGESAAAEMGVRLCGLEELAETSKSLFVTASPTHENKGLVSRDLIARMQKGALLLVISRAHLVDYSAAVAAAAAGAIRLATDVYPSEPLEADDPSRTVSNVIHSPHRAAAVPGGRHLIGEMIKDDLRAMAQGSSERRLLVADFDRVASLAGAGDAAKEELATLRSKSE